MIQKRSFQLAFKMKESIRDVEGPWRNEGIGTEELI